MTTAIIRTTPLVILGTDDDCSTCAALLQGLPSPWPVAVAIVGLRGAVFSQLSELTTRPVHVVSSDAQMQAGEVYLVPSDGAGVQVHDGRFRLAGAAASIDRFLRSVAENRAGEAMAVVLGGNGNEGLAGLQALHAEGALIYAQPPESTRATGLIVQGLALGYIDLALPLDQIVAALVRLALTPSLQAGLGLTTAAFEWNDGLLSRVLSLVHQTTGIDMSEYKQSTVRRRLLRRMSLRRVPTLASYLEVLEHEPAEVQDLYLDMLISVTHFFRDPEVYDALKADIFPQLVHQRTSDAPVRIWVPGCSTGEEAYSLAISLLESLGDKPLNVPVQIFATDINARALARARAGSYPLAIELNVSTLRLERFFVRLDAGYQISKSVRDLCIFAHHDVLRDPPFSKISLLSCRNVLIYMGPLLQQRAMRVFHYALKPTGYLVLGSSESIGRYGDLFATIDKRHRIYAKKTASVPYPPDFSRTRRKSTRDTGHQPSPAVQERYDLGHEMDRLLLARYAPAAVAINDQWEVLHFRGGTARFLEPASGPATFNLLKQVRPALLHDLRAALYEAEHSTADLVRKDAQRVRDGDEVRQVRIEVIRCSGPEMSDRFHVVTFQDLPGPEVPLAAPSPGPGDTELIASLQQELWMTRDYLNANIGNLEEANEELNTANEEIQTTNEELQSTIEELETAKEELQSTNEELTTVNEELGERNSELSRVNNDLSSLLASVNLPILMLDTALRIRRFTPLAEKIFNVQASDVGRPLREIRPNIAIPDLEELLADVIGNLTTVERRVQHQDGTWYLLRARPYQTLHRNIDGVVLVLIDVSQVGP